MDAQQFKEFGYAAIDFIADYIENNRKRDVLPSVEQGYLQPLIPDHAPQHGEPWQELMKDMDRVIMPGITHWHSPNFHAYYPTGHSYPSVVAETITSGLSVIGFNWIASPACTELEVAVMNWLGKMLNLPDVFLNCSEGPGGGVIQATASEATLIGLLAAKEKFVKEYKSIRPEMMECEVKAKLVAYSSDQSNSSIEKAGLIGSMTMRLLPSDSDGKLQAEVLRAAILKDIEKGLIPCYVIATLGTTPTCAFDDLESLGLVCKEFNVWMHVDAAYAGSAFICPEYQHHLKGVELAESFNFNPHKWMMVTFDCSALWVKDAKYLVQAFNVQRIYLKHKHQGDAPDYIHWQLALGRKFRALKLWFVLRTYGVEGLQKHVRNHIQLAKYFSELLATDKRFNVFSCSMGLVCFHLRLGNEKTQELYDKILARKQIFMVPCTIKGLYLIRFVVCARTSEKKDMDFAWREITSVADQIIDCQAINMEKIQGKNEMTKMQINYGKDNKKYVEVERTK